MASLKDIAKELNLSIPLVSTVLSGNPGTIGCSEKNRQAILAKAKELDYKPNLLARALRSGRTGSIGVFIHPMGESGSNLIERLLLALTMEANICDHRLWITFYETDNDFLQRFTKTARAEIDGLLVAGIFHPNLESLLKQIEEKGIPVVTMIKNNGKELERTNVYCDDFQLGYLPTRHLLKQSCRRIAHIHSLDARYQGYLQALKEFGLPENPALIYEATGQFGADTGHKAVQHWRENNLEFDGLLTESDHQAFGAITELLAHGKRVPEDVKVFGVDNSPICALSPVPLSSISQEVDTAGRLAIEMIIKRINGEQIESATIPPVLHLRASSGD